jgi:hypothetical protein
MNVKNHSAGFQTCLETVVLQFSSNNITVYYAYFLHSLFITFSSDNGTNINNICFSENMSKSEVSENCCWLLFALKEFTQYAASMLKPSAAIILHGCSALLVLPSHPKAPSPSSSQLL